MATILLRQISPIVPSQMTIKISFGNQKSAFEFRLISSLARLHATSHDIRRFSPYPQPPLPPSSNSFHEIPCYEDDYHQLANNKTPLVYSSRSIHYIPSPKSFANKERVVGPLVDLNNNNNNNINNLGFVGKESLVNTRKSSMTPPSLGNRSPYSDGQHSPFYFERKSPSYREGVSSPVYTERPEASRQQQNSPSFPLGTDTEQRSQRFSQGSPTSRSFSRSSSPTIINFNFKEKEVKGEGTSRGTSKKEHRPLTVDPVDMLARLFPLRQTFMLRDALKNHNNDPVRAIEHLLYGKASSKETLANVRSNEPCPITSYCYNSEDSRADHNNNNMNDDLSSLAKAYDIPVSEERIVTSKIVNW